MTDADFIPRPAPSGAGSPGPRVFGRPLTPQHVEQIFREARNRRVREVMSAPVVTIGPDDPVSWALELMFTASGISPWCATAGPSASSRVATCCA